MEDGLQIQVQLRSVDGESYPELINDAAEFIEAAVEAGIARYYDESMRFDPNTGEPLMNVPVLRAENARLIAAMTVQSPQAALRILQNTEDDGLNDCYTFEPITMSSEGDDDRQ